MKSLQEIAKEEQALSSIMQLTGAFEGIASMHIARIKDKVMQSEKFFQDLWPLYSQFRVGKEFTSSRLESFGEVKDKELIIAITSEASLSGDIDHKVVDAVLQDYNPKQHDIIVLGHHGAGQLRQRNIDLLASYTLPPEDHPINFDSIVEFVRQYRTTTVYYQAYITLMTQEVKKIELSHAVRELADDAEAAQDYISDTSYIIEPSVELVVEYMERSMLYVALGQVTLFSRLAQHASRFRAMTAANSVAQELKEDTKREYNRAKRFLKDRRTREIINGLMRKASA